MQVTLGMLVPQKNGLHCMALGHALVVHFGYFTQNRWLDRYTALIKEYEVVAIRQNLAQSKIHYNSYESCADLYVF